MPDEDKPDKPDQPQPGTADPLEALDGPERAAILLMTLGEEKAAEILRHMTPNEVQTLGTAMTSINTITQQHIRGVLDTFIDNLGNQSSLSIGTQDFLHKTLTDALGRDKANNMMSQVLIDSNPKGLETLKWMEATSVANVVCNEHPQIIAIVLAHLSRDKAGTVLDLLPEEIQTDVMVRVASLDTVHPAALKELDEIMQHRFEDEPDVVIAGIGGIDVAAEILNSVSSDTEKRVFESFKELDGEISDKIQEKMFVFENLLALDDRGMQLLLRGIAQDKIVKSLKGASKEMQEKIFRNMSKNAADMMRDDLQATGPMRLKDVEEAQKEIMAIAQRLADEGQIALGGKGDDFV
jgi:flagellar motor switch protein FliG